MGIIERINEVIKRHKITYNELMDLSGLTKSEIKSALLSNNDMEIPDKLVEAVSLITNIKIEYFLYGVED